MKRIVITLSLLGTALLVSAPAQAGEWHGACRSPSTNARNTDRLNHICRTDPYETQENAYMHFPYTISGVNGI